MVGRELHTMRPTGEDHPGQEGEGGKEEVERKESAVVILLQRHLSNHGVSRSWIRISMMMMMTTMMQGWDWARTTTAMSYALRARIWEG